ncbi:uncharacterized protein EAE97_011406 [Botrytis byssoidea]|uniref:Transcription factor Iwr1 domain-containing protein n=1 Tax=Botrytis byssoidea TaxID=139641 RepID=A0A9P5LTF6_9HELO|nr:uncharacterized protein EAE97_011406 [Botrytis byssoidea]KAF7921138.1 hypothetical protein EAE97_011406 [Botrytis byssoidea]
MSLPPSIIHIKRKATDLPQDFLRVDDAITKRQRRTTDFVYSRQQTPQIDTTPSTPQSAPLGRRIKPLHRSTSSRSLTVKKQGKSEGTVQLLNEVNKEDQEVNTQPPTATIPTKQDDKVNHTSVSMQPSSSDTPLSSGSTKKAVQQRRFHLSRSATPSISPGPSTGIRKRNATVFIERRVRQKTQEEKWTSVANAAIKSENVATLQQDQEEKPQKKPGRGSRVQVAPPKETRDEKDAKEVIAPLPKPPSALVNPWGLDTDDLAAQMQAYTLQEIGRSIEESKAAEPKPSAPVQSSYRKSTSTRFKPKVPALRYKERHPEENTMEVDEDQMSRVETDGDVDTDSEYIIETYIRVPAEDIDNEDNQINFGILVLDAQSDIDEFYQDWDTDEEVEDEAEEDENDENHYTADYPDAEVDSDDEYNRNAYAYRTGNASDLEEFDEDDSDEDGMGFSDDETDKLKYPWQRVAAHERRNHINQFANGDEDEDEDME